MEQLAPQNYNPHLKRVLEKFQSAAERSLSGPASYPALPATTSSTATVSAAAWEQPKQSLDMEEYRKIMTSTLKSMQAESKLGDVGSYYNPAPFLIQPMPLLLPTDSSRGEKSETSLEGVPIACFIVGGEKRLCLPQILNTVLRDFTLQDINAVCDELHIFCSRCNREQLEILKMSQVLPRGAHSCGLITKTDAERLCNSLLHRCPEKATEPPSRNSFKVYHECFGKCKGLFNPEQYNSPNAKCIQCCDCHGLFSPQKFVCHSHKSLENRTCHWGFDSANWRAYLLLAKDQECRDRCQPILDEIKAKFDSTGGHKRKESPTLDGTEGKKIRYDGATPAWADSPHLRQMSAFRPWSPSLLSILKEGKLPYARDGLPRALPSYLQTGPPVLLNPDRVVHNTDSQSSERHFAPNVSLAPESYQKLKSQLDDPQTTTAEGSQQRPTDDKGQKAVTNGTAGNRPKGADTCPDLELSSSDSDSNKTESLPSSPRTDPRQPSLLSPASTSMDPAGEMEAELSLLQRALEGQVGDSSEARGRLLEEYRHLQQRRHDRLCQLRRTNRQLHQELEYERSSKAARLREMIEANQGLRRELERLRLDRTEWDVRLQEVMSQRDRLQARVEEMATKPTASKLAKTLQGEPPTDTTQVDCLRAKLQQQEETAAVMKSELEELRQQLTRRSDDTALPASVKPEASLDVDTTALLSPVSRENSLDSSSAVKPEPRSDGEAPSPSDCHVKNEVTPATPAKTEETEV